MYIGFLFSEYCFRNFLRSVYWRPNRPFLLEWKIQVKNSVWVALCDVGVDWYIIFPSGLHGFQVGALLIYKSWLHSRILIFYLASLLTTIFRLPLIQCGSYTIVSFNTFILQSDRFICHPANETNGTVHTSNDDELHWKVREVAEVLSVESKCCRILNDDQLVSASRCHHRWLAPSNVSRIFRNHGIYFSQCWPTCCLSHDDARRLFSHGNLTYVRMIFFVWDLLIIPLWERK